MEQAWGKAQELLELLLGQSQEGPLLKDHLLVHLVLSEGIHRHQVGPKTNSSTGSTYSRYMQDSAPNLYRSMIDGLIILFQGESSILA